MQVRKIVKKIFTPPLEKEGFLELPTKMPGMWTYGQPKEDFYHLIQIESRTIKFPSGPECTLSVSLNSTAPNGASVGLSGILDV